MVALLEALVVALVEALVVALVVALLVALVVALVQMVQVATSLSSPLTCSRRPCSRAYSSSCKNKFTQETFSGKS